MMSVPEHRRAGGALQPVPADHRRARVTAHIVQDQRRNVQRFGDPDTVEFVAEITPHTPLLSLKAIV